MQEAGALIQKVTGGLEMMAHGTAQSRAYGVSQLTENGGSKTVLAGLHRVSGTRFVEPGTTSMTKAGGMNPKLNK